jgi:hypothetical protein
MTYNPVKHGGASRWLHEKEQNARRRALIEASPGDGVEILPGVNCKIVRKIVGYDEASLAAVQRSEEAKVQKSRARHAKYDQTNKRTEARVRALELRNSDPQRKAYHNALNADYRERKRVAHLDRKCLAINPSPAWGRLIHLSPIHLMRRSNPILRIASVAAGSSPPFSNA